MNQNEFIDFTTKPLSSALQAVQTGGYLTVHPELTAEEKALIYHYTDAGSQSLNAQLYQSRGANTTALGRGLYEALQKLPAYVGQVYSAAYWNDVELQEMLLRAASEGTPLNSKHWPAFLSASKSQAVAEQFMNYSPKNCLLSIFSYSGRDIELLSRYGPNGPDPAANEREILLLPTQFRVVGARRTTYFSEIELLEL